MGTQTGYSGGTADDVFVRGMSDSNGNAANYLPPGRAAAASSVPVALSNEDYARISQTYRRTAALGSACDGVAITATGAGTVTLTLSGGGTLTVSVPVGSTILPFSATAVAAGTATGVSGAALFFT